MFLSQIPLAADSDGEYYHVEALFGNPPYGSTLRGTLVYVTPGKDRHGCPASDEGAKPYLKPAADSPDAWPQNPILMVDRGNCNFVEKVRYAQKLGAIAVIVVDNKCMAYDKEKTVQVPAFKELCDAKPYSCNDGVGGLNMNNDLCDTELPFMADDQTGMDISIPSYMISKWDGQPVMILQRTFLD